MAPIYLVLKVHCMKCWIFNANIAPYSVEKLHSDCTQVLHNYAIVVQILHHRVFNTPGVVLIL